jgi:hypothetical protein
MDRIRLAGLAMMAMILLMAAGAVAHREASAQNLDPNAIDFMVGWNPGAAVVQGQYPNCTSQAWEVYTNNSGAEVRIVAVDVWIGLYRGAYADVGVEAYVRKPTGDLRFASFRWDRYANPTQDHQRFLNFAPAYVPIAVGETIIVGASNCYVAGVSSPMHPIVDIYLAK